MTEKKNLVTITTLLLLLIVLPVGIALIRSQQIYNSKASGERIQIGTGRCVTEKDGKKVLTCNEVPLNLIAPFNPAASTSAILNKDNLMSKVSNAIVKEAKSYDKNICPGDPTAGAGGLIDVIVNGCGEVLNYEEIYHSCVSSAAIRYKPPVWNTTKHEWETIKQDGKVISQAEMIQKSQQDGRFPIALSSTDNPPWVNCEVYFEYSGRNDCDVTPQKNASGQTMGREGTELLPGQEFTMNVAKASNPNHSTSPDCKQQVQVQVGSPTPSPTVAPTPSPTPQPTVQPSATPSPTPGQCTAGTFGTAQLEVANGCGTITSHPSSGATTGTIAYTAPNTTSDIVCNLRVTTQNNGDCKLDPSGKGTAANPLKPNESLNISYLNACVDNQAGCTLPIIVSSATTVPTDKAAYKLAESEPTLAAATERGFTTQNFSAIYTLQDTTPGMKTIWVEFTNKQTGQKTKDFVSIELLESAPLLKTVSCQLDISKNAVNFDLGGLRFGNETSKVTANGTDLSVSSWNETAIKAILNNLPSDNTNIDYKLKVIRKDNTASEEVSCKLGLAQISLGTQLICRGEGKMDLSNVTVTIVDEAGNKAEETAGISKEGIISGLKTKLEVGKNYTISIKAPNILRRSISFKASAGTTVIVRDDGTKLQLPVGDIAPKASGDGTINALDQSELKNQWRIFDPAGDTALSGDFNADKRVNAFDWSCMRLNFGASDDNLPGTPSSGVLTVIFNVPTPAPTN